MTEPHEDPTCAVAHGHAPGEQHAPRTLVAVFASPVAEYLLHYGADVGYQPVLLDPDPERAVARMSGVKTTSSYAGYGGPDTAVVVTDHHRPELGAVLRDVLADQAGWIGLMGNPRHAGPHVAALTALGVPAAQIARVHRPIGLNIGSRAPAEIAISTIAGLIAERTGAPGGFEFPASRP